MREEMLYEREEFWEEIYNTIKAYKKGVIRNVVIANFYPFIRDRDMLDKIPSWYKEVCEFFSRKDVRDTINSVKTEDYRVINSIVHILKWINYNLKNKEILSGVCKLYRRCKGNEYKNLNSLFNFIIYFLTSEYEKNHIEELFQKTYKYLEEKPSKVADLRKELCRLYRNIPEQTEEEKIAQLEEFLRRLA